MNKKRVFFTVDPRTKLFLMIIISFIAITGNITGNSIYARLVILLIPSLLVVANKEIVKGTVFCLIIFLGWYAEAFLIRGESQLYDILIFVPAGIVTRFMPTVVMGYYFLNTTQVEELIEGFERLMCSRKITIPIAVMFRFLPTIKEESSYIGDAMRMRNMSLRNTLDRPITYIEYRMVPVLNSVIKIADELTIASLTKGLNITRPKTAIIQLRLKWYDVSILVLAVVLTIFYYLL
ncbi:energy-coupling factor transporter transmembrane component T [Mammaliicoccus lentus]|uniref:energy-coupling factor transporter transmembrane component T n=1 Tax=Mammaliicoccus lentus TaxID=42858 RepID=UPI002DBF98B0|nr:energy-coupling factor transporter transmembrane component T [Mammaliicoccus lentus]MEB8091044.1 energy-coupling factor transporter transmembrane protein EcfT [Mammaliicoccus lentus]